MNAGRAEPVWLLIPGERARLPALSPAHSGGPWQPCPWHGGRCPAQAFPPQPGRAARSPWQDGGSAGPRHAPSIHAGAPEEAGGGGGGAGAAEPAAGEGGPSPPGAANVPWGQGAGRAVPSSPPVPTSVGDAPGTLPSRRSSSSGCSAWRSAGRIWPGGKSSTATPCSDSSPSSRCRAGGRGRAGRRVSADPAPPCRRWRPGGSGRCGGRARSGRGRRRSERRAPGCGGSGSGCCGTASAWPGACGASGPSGTTCGTCWPRWGR